MEERGTTLLEVAVGAALAAALGAALVWNAHAWWSDFRLSTAAYQLLGDLRVVRMRALATSTSTRIAFFADRLAYRKQEKIGTSYVDTATVPLPRGTSIADCNALHGAITFTPRGTASTFGTVTLQAGGGKTARVIVDIVGRVRIER